MRFHHAAGLLISYLLLIKKEGIFFDNTLKNDNDLS